APNASGENHRMRSAHSPVAGVVRFVTVLWLVILCGRAAAADLERWTPAQANAWYATQKWPLGSNYIPANAINQLEMWQAQTFDPQRIDRELGWAEKLGMNAMRVFLHNLLWQQDAAGFIRRVRTFLEIAARHGIKPIFVLLDSCWDPQPVLGPQHPPIPGVHNSGWVQSPSGADLADPATYPRLRAYVEGVGGAFAKDNRILAWACGTSLIIAGRRNTPRLRRRTRSIALQLCCLRYFRGPVPASRYSP